MFQFENIEETIVTFDTANSLGSVRNFLIENLRKEKWKAGSKFMFVHCTQDKDQFMNMPPTINKGKMNCFYKIRSFTE